MRDHLLTAGISPPRASAAVLLCLLCVRPALSAMKTPPAVVTCLSVLHGLMQIQTARHSPWLQPAMKRAETGMVNQPSHLLVCASQGAPCRLQPASVCFLARSWLRYMQVRFSGLSGAFLRVSGRQHSRHQGLRKRLRECRLCLFL